MHIHEYQAKELLQKFGIPIPSHRVVSTLEEIKKITLREAVIKVQIHAGGRGKAGGVKFAKTPEEIVKIGQELLGKKIVNEQTGPAGLISNTILISEPVAIKKEYYLSALMDRKAGCGVIIASKEGGMEIEVAASEKPESIHKEKILPDGKLYSFQLLTIAKFMGWEGNLRKEGMALVANLAKAFTETDASLIEINPLVETVEGHLVALDAKASIDDNALFRQREIASWMDLTQLPKNEVMAKEFDLAYVGLHGEIGCMVNGAGLAMATMDMIHMHGGEPANFLDVGGSASKEKIAHGFNIILFDPAVKAIFVNIFGGIMDCGVLASGIVEASKEDGVRVPLVVRMEGTNVEIGKKILKDSHLNILSAETMEEGAKLAVQAAKGK